MKFICVRQHLEHALLIAERFTGKNLTLPILGNVLLEATENVLTVTATNLEYAVQLIVPGSGAKAGRVSVPAKIASALVQSMQDEKIQLEEKGGSVLVKSNGRDARLNGMPADDFPLMPTLQKTNSFEIGSLALQQGLASVLPAVSTSEFKPELAGVLCKVGLRTLQLAATDTFRLAEKTIPLERTGEERPQFSFILPQRMAAELSRILDGEEQIAVSLGENQVLFEREGMRVISRLIDGNFPEYGGIIPNQFETTCFLKRAEFLRAVRSSSLFASKLQDVSLVFTENQCEIASQNQEIGEYRTRIPITLSGKEGKVSFNYRYLLDGLTMLQDEEIFFGMNTEQSPALMHDRTDNSLLYVIMPIRVT